MFNKDQCVSLNYLIEELVYADVKYRFVAPMQSEPQIKLHWVSHPDQVEVVKKIVARAVSMNATVLIGTVDNQVDKTAYYIGFEVDFGVDADQ